MSAQLFFTSIDDIVLLANDAQIINLCNFNKQVHSDIFCGLHSFLRISTSFLSTNQKLGTCFSDESNQFILDQQTMLNIRIMLQVLSQTELVMSKEAKDVHSTLKNSFEKDKHGSIVKLEKTLNQENAFEYLKFFNTENNFVQDEMSMNYIEKVCLANPGNSSQLSCSTRTHR